MSEIAPNLTRTNRNQMGRLCRPHRLRKCEMQSAKCKTVDALLHFALCILPFALCTHEELLVIPLRERPCIFVS